jgi:hypothetical protein
MTEKTNIIINNLILINITFILNLTFINFKYNRYNLFKIYSNDFNFLIILYLLEINFLLLIILRIIV